MMLTALMIKATQPVSMIVARECELEVIQSYKPPRSFMDGHLSGKLNPGQSSCLTSLAHFLVAQQVI